MTRLAAIGLAVLLFGVWPAIRVSAEESADPATEPAAAESDSPRPSEGGAPNTRREAVAPEEEDAGLSAVWSATLIGQYKRIPSREANDDFGGYFDQYEFTPNKSSEAPIELGIRDGAFDLDRANGTPLLQLRLESPTSNLGVSGSQIDEPFFNQRLDGTLRLEGFDVDLRYRRMRTENLRIFPNTEGPGLLFRDRTSPWDRFQRDRTGFSGEARLRPYEALLDDQATGSRLAPELSLRGGYESRDGRSQLRIHRDPSNDWIGLPQDLDRSVADVGGGLLVSPGKRLTVSLDFDYERFRFDSPTITEEDLGYAPPATRTIGFVPSTDQSTGTLRLHSELGGRTVLEAGFQISQLEQVGELTPDQATAGLTHNVVRYYGANLSLDVDLGYDLGFNTYFKLDRRDNDIDRETSLFNDSNGTQVDPFVRNWQRILFGGELALRTSWAHGLAIGARYEDVTRDLEFALPGGVRILPENAQIARKTQIITVYGRVAARPWRTLRLDAELGYRAAPKTGYIVELDDNVYGELRASYVFASARPLIVSAFVRGATGQNGDFDAVAGQGPVPAGPLLERSYERSNVAGGVTASISPVDRLSLFASIFAGLDEQDVSLDQSTLQRYFQDQAPLGFATAGLNRFENLQYSASLGSHFEFSEQTDLGLSYAFTRARATYDGSGSSSRLEAIARNHIIDSDTHVVDLEVGHWLRDGLRVLAGYRFQLYDDRAPVVQQSNDSARAPFDPSTDQHTVTIGVTLTSELLSRGR